MGAVVIRTEGIRHGVQSVMGTAVDVLSRPIHSQRPRQSRPAQVQPTAPSSTQKTEEVTENVCEAQLLAQAWVAHKEAAAETERVLNCLLQGAGLTDHQIAPG